VAAAVVLGSGGWALNHYLNRPDTPEVSAAVRPPAETPAPAATVPAASAPADNLTVTLLGTGTCWIKYAVDGGDPTQLVLKEGDSRRIAAAEKIDLSVGNTKALELRINERDVRFPENTPIVLKKITITPETVASQFN
jgi:hypothetical protein